eukprot:scaffold138454_cov21-Tisochrysis_lutea.AAC.1
MLGREGSGQSEQKAVVGGLSLCARVMCVLLLPLALSIGTTDWRQTMNYWEKTTPPFQSSDDGQIDKGTLQQ